jgi:hypothetical protein
MATEESLKSGGLFTGSPSDVIANPAPGRGLAPGGIEERKTISGQSPDVVGIETGPGLPPKIVGIETGPGLPPKQGNSLAPPQWGGALESLSPVSTTPQKTLGSPVLGGTHESLSPISGVSKKLVLQPAKKTPMYVLNAGVSSRRVATVVSQQPPRQGNVTASSLEQTSQGQTPDDVDSLENCCEDYEGW